MANLWQEPRWPRFRAFALDAGATYEAVKKWRQRQAVPPKWHLPLLEKAHVSGFELSHDDLRVAGD